MIEDFSLEYKDFFNQSSCERRWERLKEIYREDYGSFRVLFLVETLALIDKWREPSTNELNAILNHNLRGGKVAVRIGTFMDLIQAVWPLEVAKYDVQILKVLAKSDWRGKYFFTWIKCYASALVPK